MSLTSRRTVMTRKRYKPEEIVAKLRQVDILVSQGQNMVDAIRQIGVSEVTYYRWRQEFGGLARGGLGVTLGIVWLGDESSPRPAGKFVACQSQAARHCSETRSEPSCRCDFRQQKGGEAFQ